MTSRSTSLSPLRQNWWWPLRRRHQIFALLANLQSWFRGHLVFAAFR